MEINKIVDNDKVTLKIEGELEMTKAKLLEEEINKLESNVKTLILDLEKLDYTASAGIRTFLLANKVLKERNGELKIINVNSNVYEILKMASLIDLLKPEKMN